jgi:hypothetical protein
MSFQKLISTIDSKYIVEFESDFSLPIETGTLVLRFYHAVLGNPLTGIFCEDDGLYYTKSNIVIDLKSAFVDTLNFGKGFYDYTPPANELGVKLFKQSTSLNLNTNEYDFLEVTPNLNNKGEAYYLNMAASGDAAIQLSLLTSPAASVTEVTTFAGSFEADTTYQLTIEIGKLLTSAHSTDVTKLNFRTKKVETTSNSFYNNVPSNVLYKLNHLDVAKDIDNLDKFADVFNYKFTPVTKSVDGKTIAEVDINNAPVTLNFNISDFLEKSFINQYLVEYDKYFMTISDDAQRVMDTTPLLKKQIADLKKILLKNSNLINASFKGSQKGMSIIFGIFCQALGYHLLKLEPSPLLKPFVYRITSSLPKEFWTSDIKDIIHPFSWADEYIEVDINSTTNNLFYEDGIKSKVINKSNPVSYLDINNIEKYHMYPDIFDLSVLKNFNGEDAFEFHANEYSANQTNMSLNPELYYDSNFVGSFITGSILFRLNYFQRYHWELTNNDFLTSVSIDTFTNYLTGDFNKYNNLRLKVTAGEWTSPYIYFINTVNVRTEAGDLIITEDGLLLEL